MLTQLDKWFLYLDANRTSVQGWLWCSVPPLRSGRWTELTTPGKLNMNQAWINSQKRSESNICWNSNHIAPSFPPRIVEGIAAISALVFKPGKDFFNHILVDCDFRVFYTNGFETHLTRLRLWRLYSRHLFWLCLNLRADVETQSSAMSTSSTVTSTFFQKHFWAGKPLV